MSEPLVKYAKRIQAGRVAVAEKRCTAWDIAIVEFADTIERTERERDEAIEAIACLHAEQNGPPLIHHEAAWNAAMAKAEAILGRRR